MKSLKEYGGIDYVRVIAAFLIVAIHTSPLANINGTADFVLTRIIARVAVPFFFMTTGFFLFSEQTIHKVRISRFLKRTGIIYGMAIILYIPLNIYMGYHKQRPFLYELLQDLIFDGTIYHLWYLPAAMLGVILVWLFLAKVSLRKTFLIFGILYLLGVFGDSYYGLAEKVPIIKGIYQGIFMISDYTRNGIFFAPIFILMGGCIARKKGKYELKSSLKGLFLFTLLFIAEGIILYKVQLMRHDSMYIMLLPCMYFLFTSILHWKVANNKRLRTLSLVIYLVHPMVIVMIRAFSKRFNMQEIFVDHNLIHFILVSVGSFFIAVIVTLLLKLLEERNKIRKEMKISRSWIEINLQNLKHNVRELNHHMPTGCEMMAVVKANAYGHGAVMVSKSLYRIGVRAFAVATIEEGIDLRKKGVKGEILILGYTDVSRAEQLKRYHLTQTIIDYDYALMLNRQNKNVPVHVKIDTGMHRLGLPVEDRTKILEVFRLEKLQVKGIFTHLCTADSLKEEAVNYTKGQIDAFYQLLQELKKCGISRPKVHIQSSYGLLNYPELQCDYARIGIALYGSHSAQGDRTRLDTKLQPVLALKSRIAMIRDLAAGEGISYGRDTLVDKNSRIAILPIGYADGLPRNLSGRNASVLLKGKRVPIIGRICMDQLLIDITDMPDIKPGDIATLIGSDGQEEIQAVTMANTAGTITNELFSRLGERIERVYV